MPKVSINDAKVVNVEGHDGEALVVRMDDVVEKEGVRFITLGAHNTAVVKWATGGTRPTREMRFVHAELMDLRMKACERLVCRTQHNDHTLYKQYKRKRATSEIIESRQNEVVEVALPQFMYGDETIAAVRSQMPMRYRGDIQLQLEEQTLAWYWSRVQSAAAALPPPRSKPGGAEHAPQDGSYFHSQKHAYVARRPDDAVAVESSETIAKYKLFKLPREATTIDAMTVASAAVAWAGAGAPEGGG